MRITEPPGCSTGSARITVTARNSRLFLAHWHGSGRTREGINRKARRHEGERKFLGVETRQWCAESFRRHKLTLFSPPKTSRLPAFLLSRARARSRAQLIANDFETVTALPAKAGT